MDDPEDLEDLCVYCGTQQATTMDHVIPRCLFVPPLPSDMVTVPVCDACNNRKSKNDSYFRDMLVLDLQTSEHAVAKTFLKDKVLRAVQKNRSEVARPVLAGRARMSPLHTSGGIYLGHYPSVPIDGDRVNETVSTMVKGLYFKLKKKRIPDNYVFDIRRVDPLYVRSLHSDMVRMKANGPYILANVFGCMFLYAVEDQFVTSWFLSFLDGFVLIVHTAPEDVQ